MVVDDSPIDSNEELDEEDVDSSSSDSEFDDLKIPELAEDEERGHEEVSGWKWPGGASKSKNDSLNAPLLKAQPPQPPKFPLVGSRGQASFVMHSAIIAAGFFVLLAQFPIGLS